MRRTIRKLFWVWNFDKEEKWLNEMAAKGLGLVAIGFCKYTFEESTPSEYNIRLELLENVPTHLESEQYIKFVEETGAEYLGSYLRWVYFRKKRSDGEFNLYSDCNSRIKHLNRILTLLTALLFLTIPNGINNIWLYLATGAPWINLSLGILCITFGLLIGYGFIKIFNKKRKLQKHQQLFES